MIVQRKISRIISIRPDQLDCSLEQNIKRCALAALIASNNSNTHFKGILQILSQKQIQSRNGKFQWKVDLLCEFYRVFKDEVVDKTRITSINNTGIFALVHGIQIFIPQLYIPADFVYSPLQNEYKSKSETLQPGVEKSVKIVYVGSSFPIGALQ